jgi:hypothetical protein
MTTLTGWLAIANLIILVFGSIGGMLAFRSALAKAENDVQSRVRDALSAENELLQSRVNRLEKDNRRLNKLLQLIAQTLKKTHGIELEADDGMVILRDSTGQHTVRVEVSDTSA